MRIGFCAAFGTMHSVAVAGQFLALALARHNWVTSLEIHEGVHTWPKFDQGLHFDDQQLLASLPNTTAEISYDALITYGCETAKLHFFRKAFNYFVTEYGGNVPNYSQIDQTNSIEKIIVPSIWVKTFLLRAGFPDRLVTVVNCGIASKYYYSFNDEIVSTLRNKLGISEETFVFLNIGAMTTNKGIELLLKAFDTVVKISPNCLLILKDSSHLYGINASHIVNSLVMAGKISVASLSFIRIVSGSLSISNMASIYNIADCYVSPYLAEGFNAPVLEAIACGTPVIVTSGGPTDEFVSTKVGVKINSQAVESFMGVEGSFLIPDVDHLVSLMVSEITYSRKHSKLFIDASVNLADRFSYDSIASRFLRDNLASP
jgi:glycosyltransferase involved in cell wall biosynthesis